MVTNPVEQITTRGIATIRGVQSHLDAAINLVRSRTDAAAPVSLLSPSNDQVKRNTKEQMSAATAVTAARRRGSHMDAF